MGDKQNLAKESQLALKQDKLIAGANITIALDGKTISAANPTSVTVTPVYQAGTLVAAIVVNGNTTNIYAPAQHGDNANQNLALSFSTSQTYEVGDFVIYQENLYQCITAISTPAAWDSTKWTRALITDVMGQGSGGDYANQNIANTHDTTATYDVGDYVIYNGLLYKCITAVTTPGLWNATYWTQTIIVDEMGGGGSSVSALEDLTDVDITSPAANDTIKWNATTQKWENGAGGGSSGKNYSTSEHIIGTWIDGSPLYEQTLYLDISGQPEHWYVFLNTIISDIDNYSIINWEGFLQFKEGSTIYTWNSCNSGGSYTIYRNNGQWYLYFHSGNASCTWGAISATIRYVKKLIGSP